MRLIDTTTYELKEFFGTIPKYAILSHTWEGGEVSFQEFQNLPSASHKPGFAKIRGACEQALRDQLQYCWVDTCCIDKTSSAELSEAINSMFAWYQNAVVCYAYLADVIKSDQISSSTWFTRGWTLQELLAPENVAFYSAEWKLLGTKKDQPLCDEISRVTNIENDYLRNRLPTWRATIAKRMSWMSKRATTRIEDVAYCLLGIFEIHMPLLYGEGAQSFIRLQEEIIKQSNDQTIFCWAWKPDMVPRDWLSVLAPCPAVFESSSHYHSNAYLENMPTKPYSITNAGLSIEVSIVPTESTKMVLAILMVSEISDEEVDDNPFRPWYRVCIVLQVDRNQQIYKRMNLPEEPFQVFGGVVHRREVVFIQCGKRNQAIYRSLPYNMECTQESRFQTPNFGIFLLNQQVVEHGHSLNLSSKTDNVSYFRHESLLIFSFTEIYYMEDTGVAMLTNRALKEAKLALCFAVRKVKTKDGNFQHQSSCYLISLAASSPKQALDQTKKDFLKNNRGGGSARSSSNAVLLGHKTLYSSMNGSTKNLQLAYLAFENKRFAGELLSVAYPSELMNIYES